MGTKIAKYIGPRKAVNTVCKSIYFLINSDIFTMAGGGDVKR